MRRSPFRPTAAITFGLLIGVAGMLATVSSFGEPLDTGEPTNQPAPAEQLIVKYKANANRESLRKRVNELKATESLDNQPLRMKVVKVSRALRDKTRQQLAADPAVEYVEVDVARELVATVPNDPYYNRQWVWPKTQTDLVWDKTKGSSSVTIAVIDSGTFAQHPELSGKLVPGYDFYNQDSDPEDQHGHGTGVASTVAANTSNGQGISSGCWNCRIMSLKTHGADGKAGNASDIARAIQYAADRNVKIINLSVGGKNLAQAERDAVVYAQNKGVLLIASSGNDGDNTVNYPANHPGVLSIAATDRNENLADFSTYGPNIDIAAPGIDIIVPGHVNASDYFIATGTSYSAPVVTGIAGLLLSAFPQATSAQLTDALTKTTDPCCGGRIAGGRVNANNAYNYLANLFPPVTPGTGSPDINGDKRVNLTDLSILLSQWNTTNTQTDLDRDGRVNLRDLSILLSNWNRQL